MCEQCVLCDWSLFTGLQSRIFSTKFHGMVDISEMSRVRLRSAKFSALGKKSI